MSLPSVCSTKAFHAQRKAARRAGGVVHGSSPSAAQASRCDSTWSSSSKTGRLARRYASSVVAGTSPWNRANMRPHTDGLSVIQIVEG